MHSVEAMRSFIQTIADMVGDELDAHGSTELRAAARNLLSTLTLDDGVTIPADDLAPAEPRALARSIAEVEAWERDGIALCEIENEVSFGESVCLCLHELKRLRAAAPAAPKAPIPADYVLVPRSVIRELRLAEDAYASAKPGAVERLAPAIEAVLAYEKAAAKAPPVLQPEGVERLVERVAEIMKEDGGCWHACSGCQESEDGYVSEKLYPYNAIFKCQPGGGCRECGGIGVLWEDGAFLAGYGLALTHHPIDESAGHD